jgi:hypothetical protein
MAMPETAMHKNDDAPGGKNDVWPTGQPFVVEPVTQTCRP